MRDECTFNCPCSWLCLSVSWIWQITIKLLEYNHWIYIYNSLTFGACFKLAHSLSNLANTKKMKHLMWVWLKVMLNTDFEHQLVTQDLCLGPTSMQQEAALDAKIINTKNCFRAVLFSSDSYMYIDSAHCVIRLAHICVWVWTNGFFLSCYIPVNKERGLGTQMCSFHHTDQR